MSVVPMVHEPHSPEEHHEHFSLPLFATTVLLSVTALLVGLRLLAPSVWDAQFLSPLWKGAVAFAAISLVNCFVEYVFHRYVLHTPGIPVLRRLYKQHTLHHALTRIGRRTDRSGRDVVVVVENKFPIIEDAQGEASFFPWYSMIVFAAVLTPLLAGLHWLLPSFPWFFGGYLALASSMTLYEVLHAINHWPFETWQPLIEHRVWGRFWRPAYAFHLRHHAVIDCNESISGFFGLPVADWVFGTCLIPKTVYADGEEWTPDKFISPRPVWPIRALDVWFDGIVRNRRARAVSAAASETDSFSGASGLLNRRRYTRGEVIASWVTHGVGLAASVAALSLLIVFASLRGNAWEVVSFTVFGLTLTALYVVSALHQAQRREGKKLLFRKLNHSALCLVVAGTYTPFLLSHLHGPLDWSLFGAMWGICGAGAVFHLVSQSRNRLASALAYLFVAWLLVVAIEPMLAYVPHSGHSLLLIGGALYTLGVGFYLWNRLRYHQAVWQTCVLGGSTCHILAVLLFLLPVGR